MVEPRLGRKVTLPSESFPPSVHLQVDGDPETRRRGPERRLPVVKIWLGHTFAAAALLHGPHHSAVVVTACSSAAELLAGDAAADVEQMVLGVVQCVADDGGRVDDLMLGVDSDHSLLFRCQ